MLFTWDTTNLCIVFRGWRITGTLSLIVSLLAIILLTAGYEAVREASRRYEAHAARVGEGRRDGGELCESLWNICGVGYLVCGVLRFRTVDAFGSLSIARLDTVRLFLKCGAGIYGFLASHLLR